MKATVCHMGLSDIEVEVYKGDINKLHWQCASKN